MSLANTKKIQNVLKRVEGIDTTDMNTFGMIITDKNDGVVTCKEQTMKMAASYDYLGLSNDKRIIAAAVEATKKFGTGSSGPRHFAGTCQLHTELEQKLAQLKRKEDAVVYSGGFITNLSCISALMDERDLILVDSYCHQSIIDGCIASGAEWMRFKHNNIQDLETKLQANSLNTNRVLIIFEGVYSMDGDVPDATGIIRTAKKYGAYTMVDEAHALGVLGETGRGVDEYFDLGPDDIDLYMGTLSKAIPGVGGYIACSKDIATFLRFGSNGYIFSCSNTPANMATAIKALEIMETEPERNTKLKRNIKQFITGCQELGFDTLNSKDSAVIPINIGNETIAVIFAKMLCNVGIFTCPIVYPAVPQGMNRIRFCIRANHTEEDIEFFLRNLEIIAEKLNIKLSAN